MQNRSRLISELSKLFTIALVMVLITIYPLSAQPQNRVNRIISSGDRQIIAVAYRSFTGATPIEFFDAVTGSLIDSADLALYFPHQIALNFAGDQLAWVDGSSTIGIYDRDHQSNTIIAHLSGITIEHIEWSPISDHIAWTEGNSVVIFDVGAGRISGYIISDQPSIAFFSWSPDGQHIATSHVAGYITTPNTFTTSIQVWDTPLSSNDITVPSLSISDYGGGSISWSPDSARLAALHPGGFLVIHADTGEFEVVPVDEEYLNTVVWSPDSQSLVTGGSRVRIWNATTLQLQHELPFGASAMQWSADGHQIFSN